MIYFKVEQFLQYIPSYLSTPPLFCYHPLRNLSFATRSKMLHYLYIARNQELYFLVVVVFLALKAFQFTVQ